MRETKRKAESVIRQRLRERREFLVISERVAATAMGFKSHSSIRDQESGRRRIPADLLPVYARAYRCKVQDFYRPPGSPWTERKRHTAATLVRSERLTRGFRKPTKMIKPRVFVSYRRNDAVAAAVTAAWQKIACMPTSIGVDIPNRRIFSAPCPPCSARDLLAQIPPGSGLTSAVIEHFTSTKLTAEQLGQRLHERMREKWGKHD